MLKANGVAKRKRNYTNQSIEKAISILNAFSVEHPEMSFSELQNYVGINRSTLHRFLVTLLDNGYLEKNTSNDCYRLGIKLFELGNIVMKNMDIRRISAPIMEKLSQQLNETVHLVVRDGNEGIYVEKFEPPGAVVNYSLIGKRLPLHCTAVGKVIMAFLDDEYQNELLEEISMNRYTYKTITDKEVLREYLSQVREQGFALDDEELEEGLTCFAVPIYGQEQKVVAALSISGASHRIRNKLIKEREEVLLALRQAAADISRQLGYIQE